MIDFQLDDASIARLNALASANLRWHEKMYMPVANELANIAKEYMKPLMHVRPQYTGQLEASLTSQIAYTGDGWEVTFQGLDYGNWVDVGQDYTILYASQYGYQAFPVDKRFGAPTFAQWIHAIGKSPTSPYDTPLRFSQKTADYLVQGEAMKVLEKHMEDFLNTVVIP